MFAKGAVKGRVITEVYNNDKEVFSTSAKTYLLDKWVFDRVKNFLSETEQIEELKQKDQVVMFLHLLGMDTSGHIHKPHSERFTENLRFLDRGLREVVGLIESKFDDDKTAFIFTSDHGMTNRGSHGAGHHHETETPFLAWGAGINYWKPAGEDFVTKTFVTIDGIKIPRYDIQQADAAPLMSSLIGTAIPTNSFGKLPYMYPNVTKTYLANAFSQNAYQLHTMYEKLAQQAAQKTFHFSFNLRESKIEEEITFMDEQIRLSFTLKDYDDIIVKSHNMISLIYDGIDFYQMYYKNELLIALTFGMVGWIALLYQFVITSKITYAIDFKTMCTGCGLIVIIAGYNLLQHAPLIVIGYFLLPIPLWMLVIANNEGGLLQKVFKNFNQFLVGVVCVVVAEVLVFSFFQRKILSVVLLLYTGTITAYALRKKLEPKLKTLKYFSSAVCLGIFPLLKVVDKDTKNSILL